jgi:hypothetical protein
MKKFVLLLAALFILTFLPLGLVADDNVDQATIPNHTISQDVQDEDKIPNLAEETEGYNLNPTERRIVTKDIIRSNASTAIPVQVGQ